MQLSVIGQVKAMCINDNGLMLVLGRPEMCSETMHLYWWQEILVLERIELHDDFIDHRLGAVHVLPLGCVNHSEVCSVSSY